MNVRLEAGAFQVFGRRIELLRVDIKTIQSVFHASQAISASLARLLNLFQPQLTVVPLPAFKPPLLAIQSRRDISRHHSGFNQQGGGTTHRINQVATLLEDLRPTGTNQNRRGQVFF